MAPRLQARPILTLGYRGVLGLTSATFGLDPLAAIAADPRANRPSDPIWKRQAEARRLAIYLSVTEADLPMSLVGDLAGITKQGVSKLLHEIEDARDDPRVDQLLDRVAAAISAK